MQRTLFLVVSVAVVHVAVSGCQTRQARERTSLFNFRPVSSPNPSHKSGVVRRNDGDGPDDYSYTVPHRKLMWVTEGVTHSSNSVNYSGRYGSGHEEFNTSYEHEYPSRYFITKRNDPVHHDGGELVGLDIQSAEQVISPDGDIVDVRVRISAPSRKSAQRDGNNITFVIDASESMREPEKLELLRASSHYLIDQIFPGDRASLVIVTDRVRVALRTTEKADKAELHAMVDALQPRGSGQLATALDEGYSHMESIVLEDGEAGHVVLVTDGEAGRGGAGAWRFVSMALRRHAQKGVQLSVIGVGRQMDAPFLSELAREGDGRFAYVQNAREVGEVLGRELETMLHVYARNVRLRVVTNEGAQVLSAHGLEFPNPKEGVDELALADLVPGEQRSLLLRIQFPPSDRPARLFPTDFRLRYERVAPLRRNTLERTVSVRSGSKTKTKPANEKVDVYSKLVIGMETIRLALDSGNEASVKVVHEMLEKDFPKLREAALKSADRDLVHHAQLFEYFAGRLKELVFKGKLQGASEERNALRKELLYRRYSVRTT